MSLFAPKTLFPSLIFLAVFTVGLRLDDMWETLKNPSRFEKASVTVTLAPEAEASPAKAAEPPTAPAETETKAAPSPSIDDFSPQATMALAKQLIARRDALEKREQQADEREALLKVAEQRVDQKIKEMETLQTQLQKMLGQVDASQQAQIENLVKIYETMKAKEAARIFETLDMPVLLGVIQKMKAQKTAAVMAEMNPQKAKEITEALTKQDQLPKLK